jgi:hypothetical protein
MSGSLRPCCLALDLSTELKHSNLLLRRQESVPIHGIRFPAAVRETKPGMNPIRLCRMRRPFRSSIAPKRNGTALISCFCSFPLGRVTPSLKAFKSAAYSSVQTRVFAATNPGNDTKPVSKKKDPLRLSRLGCGGLDQLDPLFLDHLGRSVLRNSILHGNFALFRLLLPSSRLVRKYAFCRR